MNPFHPKSFALVLLCLLVPLRCVQAVECWFYSGLPSVHPLPWETGNPCSNSGCIDSLGLVSGSTAGQLIGHEHRNWHCIHCIPGSSASAAAKNGYGRAFLAFHRQFILDFDIRRIGDGEDRLEIWDAQDNDPVPGDYETTSVGFSRCSTDPSPLTVERPAGAICTGCQNLPAAFIGSSLGSFGSLGEIGYELEVQWHGSFHNGVSALGCPDIGGFFYTPRDPAFWMGHKKLDEISRDWQRLKATDIVIVIDRSGSMDDNCSSPSPPASESPCKINDAKTAATLLANIIQDVRMEGGVVAAQQHRIGLVSFSSTASTDLGLTPAAGIITDDGVNNTPFETALAGIATGGNTSIAAGIRQAISILNSVADPNPHQAIVVLTDGKENISPCLGGSSPSACVPSGAGGTLTVSEVGDIQIVAIGIEGGPLGGSDEANLRDVAERHGGTFLAQADVNAVLTWQKFFVDAFGHIFDASVSADPIGILLSGQIESERFPIEVCGLDERVSLVAGWEQLRRLETNCTLEVRLFTPSGKQVDRFDAAVEAGHGSAHDFMHVNLPYHNESTGTWSGQIVRRPAPGSPNCPTQRYFYSTLVKGLGRVDPFVVRPKVVLGRKILATFRVSPSNRPIGGYDRVDGTVTLTRPDGSTELYPLFDDGSNGDKLAGNHVFSVEVPMPAMQLGVHHLHGRFKLTKDGCTREREAQYSIVVERQPIQCTKVDAGGPLNGFTWHRPQPGDIVPFDELVCLKNRCASSNQYELQITDTLGWLKTRDARTGNLVDLPPTFRSGIVPPFGDQCFGRGANEGNPGGGIPLVAVIPRSAQPGDKSIVTVRVVPLLGNEQPTTVTTAIQVYPPPDCNGNGIDDRADLASGTLKDANSNGVPDECEFSGDHFGLGPKLTIERKDDAVTVSWSPPFGTLQQAPSVTGPWSDVPNATNPYVLRIGRETARFFRIRHDH